MSRSGRVVALVMVFFCLTLVALGQALPTITLSPMIASVQLAPGDSYLGAFLVKNEGKENAVLTVSLRDFTFTKEGAIKLLDPGTMEDYSLADMLTYTPEEIQLAPGESQKVTYSFTLPQGAKGPHWAALVVEPESVTQGVPKGEGEESVALLVHVQFKFVFVIFQRSPTPPKPVGRVVKINVSGRTEHDAKVLTSNTTFENMCNSVLECQFYIEVRDARGETILRYDSPPDLVVLPNAQRVFSHTFEDADLSPGQYMILCVIDFGGDHLVGGQYIATIKGP